MKNREVLVRFLLWRDGDLSNSPIGCEMGHPVFSGVSSPTITCKIHREFTRFH